MARPKVYTIKLTDDECSKLSQVIRNKSTCKTVLKRCQILRVLDIVRGTGLTHTQIAHSYAVCLSTVSNVIQLYNQKGIDSVVKYNISPNLEPIFFLRHCLEHLNYQIPFDGIDKFFCDLFCT